MASAKANPNLTQAQYATLTARVNELTGYTVKQELYEKRKPKETAALRVAQKCIKEHGEKCNAARLAVDTELAKARAIANESLLFGTQASALAAIKKLEALYG